MSAAIEFYFDFSSPYSYLASELIDELAAKYGRAVEWRPIMLGAAFQKAGTQLLINVPLKGPYSLRDFSRSARFYGVNFKFPQKFPLATHYAARAYYSLMARSDPRTREFAHAIFRAYWVDGRDISELPIMLKVATETGFDAQALSEAVNMPEIKERLRAETEAAIARGMFGAPYIIVDGEPFWGADRLPQIERWLATGGF